MDIPFTLHLNNRSADRHRIQATDVDHIHMGASAKALTQNHSSMQARSLPLRDSGATEMTGIPLDQGASQVLLQPWQQASGSLCARYSRAECSRQGDEDARPKSVGKTREKRSPPPRSTPEAQHGPKRVKPFFATSQVAAAKSSPAKGPLAKFTVGLAEQENQIFFHQEKMHFSKYPVADP